MTIDNFYKKIKKHISEIYEKDENLPDVTSWIGHGFRRYFFEDKPIKENSKNDLRFFIENLIIEQLIFNANKNPEQEFQDFLKTGNLNYPVDFNKVYGKNLCSTTDTVYVPSFHNFQLTLYDEKTKKPIEPTNELGKIIHYEMDFPTGELIPVFDMDEVELDDKISQNYDKFSAEITNYKFYREMTSAMWAHMGVIDFFNEFNFAGIQKDTSLFLGGLHYAPEDIEDYLQNPDDYDGDFDTVVKEDELTCNIERKVLRLMDKEDLKNYLVNVKKFTTENAEKYIQDFLMEYDLKPIFVEPGINHIYINTDNVFYERRHNMSKNIINENDMANKLDLQVIISQKPISFNNVRDNIFYTYEEKPILKM
jgi:hypothetical protein